MKNLRKIFIFIIALIPCVFMFGGCSLLSEKVYVTDIKATETVGSTTTYTVYYSNGTHSLFTVENGTNGQDGKNLTIESIKEYCETNNIDFETFLKEYLTVDNSESIQQATAVAIQSAVSVWCEFPVSDYYTKDTSISCGAGVIYQMNDTYSYIITNYHVVYYPDCNTSNKIANKIHVFQYGTSEYAYETGKTSSNGYPEIAYGDGAVEAKFIGGALNYDIAVLRVATEDLLKYNEHATSVNVANGYDLAETAIAIGNPETEGISVTSGIISVESENITMTGADDITQCSFRVMRIDAAVNGGNSGGGLFNIKGELIGIVNAKVVDSQIDNIAYALPYDNVTKVADNLIYYYEKLEQIELEKDEEDREEVEPSNVKKLVLGIEVFADNSRSIYNPTTKVTTLKEDIVVNSVSLTSNSLNGTGIAYLMKMQAGDIIKSISINGEVHTLTRMHELGDWLIAIRPGDKLLISVERDGAMKTLGFAEATGILEEYLTDIR